MREYIEERAVEIANYIIENNATVRQTRHIRGGLATREKYLHLHASNY